MGLTPPLPPLADPKAEAEQLRKMANRIIFVETAKLIVLLGAVIGFVALAALIGLG